MADASANRSPSRGIRTICLPCTEEEYPTLVRDSQRFRCWLQESFRLHPELFPESFAQGFCLDDRRTSKKTGLVLRRIKLRDGQRFTIRPAFMMPYMTAGTGDVENPLFLRRFGVPYWALAHVFGRNPMYWFRLECQLGRNSLVGTTVRKSDIPEDLLADEHHQTCDGDKVFVATTVAAGCCLGVAVAEAAGTQELTAAYQVFRDEACNVDPAYAPKTVNTDGWQGTQAAWRTLFPLITLLRCFLHGWLKIRDRAKNLKEQFFELSTQVWDLYHAPNKRSFAQRLRHLEKWASRNLSGVVLEAVRDLCAKKSLWLKAYDHPRGHRTSNMLDRIMRPMNRYFFDGQHLHGTTASNERHIRGWALLLNFAPWNPATTKANDGWQSPAERLNKYRYHDNWLQNLLISASLGGYRIRAPQNA
jgi:hypothetical protein